MPKRRKIRPSQLERCRKKCSALSREILVLQERLVLALRALEEYRSGDMGQLVEQNRRLLDRIKVLQARAGVFNPELGSKFRVEPDADSR